MDAGRRRVGRRAGESMAARGDLDGKGLEDDDDIDAGRRRPGHKVLALVAVAVVALVVLGVWSFASPATQEASSGTAAAPTTAATPARGAHPARPPGRGGAGPRAPPAAGHRHAPRRGGPRHPGARAGDRAQRHRNHRPGRADLRRPGRRRVAGGRHRSVHRRRRRRHHGVLPRGRRDGAAGRRAAGRPVPADRWSADAVLRGPRADGRGRRRRRRGGLAALTGSAGEPAGRRRNTLRPSSVGRSVRSLRGPARPRPRTRGRGALAALLTLLLAGALAGALAVVLPAGPAAAADVRTEDARVPSGSGADAVELDTTLYLPSSATADTPAPAVVLAHGFGGSKQSVAGDARDLAERGFVVLTYSARGFGRSTGQIGLDDPRYEVADLSTLLDRLSARDDVLQDGPGDPRVGVAGASYGGALSLLGAAYDDRVDAIAPQITWNSLTAALFPSQTGSVDGAQTVAATPQTAGTGVYKRTWAGLFFGVGATPTDLLGSLLAGGTGGDGATP